MSLTKYVERLHGDKEPKQMALVFGESFAGKTYAVGQLARKYKLIWLDLEHGAATLATAIPPEFHENVTLVEIKDTPQKPIAVNAVIKILRATGPVKLKAEDGSVGVLKPEEEFIELDPTSWGTDTVLVIDTLTALSDSAINHYLGTKSDTVFTKKEYSHYDHQGLYLNNALISAQRLGCHVVFITHQEEIEQEDGSEKLTPVGGTRNFAKKIARKFDHTIHCKIYNRKHTYNSVTIKDHKVIAGSRLNVNIESAEDFANMFNLGAQAIKAPSPGTQVSGALKSGLAAKLGK